MSNGITAFARLAEQARSRIVEITPQELSRAKPLPVILDVREANEYAQGHIAGAKSLSRGILEQKVDQLIPDFSTPIVVYCSRGERGALAADNLLKMGYYNVRSLKGGLQNWLESGGMVETSRRFQNPHRERHK
jgi:rhodanese-related sulfurtransferase